jgi:hypothetical protein
MMVQTIDKVYVDTISLEKKFWTYFFPRIFLGCLLALFMSSPLDHYLFREQIEDQMRENAKNNWITYQEDVIKGSKIEDVKNTKKEQDSLKVIAENALKNNPTTVAFLNAERDKSAEENRLNNTLKPEKRKLENQKEIARKAIPLKYDSIHSRYVWDRDNPNFTVRHNAWNAIDINSISKTIKESEEKISGFNKIIEAEREKHETEWSVKHTEADSLFKHFNKIQTEKQNEIDKKTEDQKKFAENLSGFDTKFMTLLTHPNFGVQFLRWFIFLVFFMIEILPTWMKLMGKPKEYDIILDQLKNKRIEEFENIVEQEKKIAEIKKQAEIALVIDQEKQRSTIELENHEKIMKNIAEEQYNIAQIILNEWKEKIKQKSN